MEKINIKDFTDETDLKSNGVYLITHKDSNLKYIGSTFYKYGFSGRWRSHINGWKRGIGNVILLRIYNKYGLEGFKFQILEKITDESIVRDREKYWIDFYDTYNNGANISLDTYQSFKCYKHRPYTEKDKMKYLLSSPTRRKVYLYNKEGKLLYVFPSSVACDRFFNLEKRRTNWVINHPIRSICKGEYYPSYELKLKDWNPQLERQKIYKKRAIKIAENRKKNGTYWMDDEYKSKIRQSNSKKKSVKLVDLEGNLIKEFISLNECDDYLKLTRGSTSKVLKGKAKTLKRKYIPIII